MEARAGIGLPRSKDQYNFLQRRRPPARNPDVYSCGVQFVDLDPVHDTLLQNITYEALLAERFKIV